MFLVVDLGTTSVRSSIIDKFGKTLAFEAREYPIIHPKPDWAEQDPLVWWKNVVITMKAVTAKVKQNKCISAITVTSQREGLVPVDDKCRCLSNCIIWMDKRTVSQAEEVKKVAGTNAVFKLTGLRIDPSFSLCKLLWIKHNKPELYRSAYKFLQAEDYIIAKLTGRFVTEPSIASRTMMLDIRKRVWSRQMFTKFGVDTKKFPEILESGTVVGEVLPSIAREVGLEGVTKVITGGGDQQCAAVGVGAVKEGIVSVSIGTSSVLSMTLNHPVLDPGRKMLCCCAAVPGKWELEPPIWTTGVLLRWCRDVLYENTNYDDMVSSAVKTGIGAGKLVVLPYFMGAGAPLWNPDARGVFIGLTLGHTRENIVRAVLESVAYEIRSNLEYMEHLGVKIGTVILSGGGAKSRLWAKIVADCIGKRIVLTASAEAATLGAAVLASTSTGTYQTVYDAVKHMVHHKSIVIPDKRNYREYTKYYGVYKNAYAGLEKVFHLIAGI
ncbi:MAG: xylulokinase [Elusimicrobiota bacterium]